MEHRATAVDENDDFSKGYSIEIEGAALRHIST
jgi:hypothetical protein